MIDKADFIKKTKGLYPKQYNEKVKKWIIDRYGEDKAKGIWINIQDIHIVDIWRPIRRNMSKRWRLLSEYKKLYRS